MGAATGIGDDDQGGPCPAYTVGMPAETTSVGTQERGVPLFGGTPQRSVWDRLHQATLAQVGVGSLSNATFAQVGAGQFMQGDTCPGRRGAVYARRLLPRSDKCPHLPFGEHK